MNMIKLFNRYGDDIYLEQAQDGSNIYYLKGDLSYMRIIGEPDNIDAIDPSGGPYMAVDYFKINNDLLVLKAIRERVVGNEFNWELEFDNA